MPMLDVFMPLPSPLRAAAIATLLLGKEQTRDGWPTQTMVRNVAKLFDVDADRLLAVFGYLTVIDGARTYIMDISDDGHPKSNWGVPDSVRQPFEVFRSLAALEPGGRYVRPLPGGPA